MLFHDTLCLVRGGGDLATGVVHRLHRAGFAIVVLELGQPRVVRRMASVAQAIYDGEIELDGMVARRLSPEEAVAAARGGVVPVLADSRGEAIAAFRPHVVVDARMRKAPLDATPRAAPLVIGLGPGFEAGEHCHAVVETNRGHDMGRVLYAGSAQDDTGRPEPVQGYDVDRVLRAPASGLLRGHRQIGDLIRAGELIADVGGEPVVAPFAGALRGLMHSGLTVEAQEKIGDLDPRQERRFCFTISDKSLAVGGGVLEAVLTWLQRQ